MQQINHINTLFMQEKDKPDFNMENLKKVLIFQVVSLFILHYFQ